MSVPPWQFARRAVTPRDPPASIYALRLGNSLLINFVRLFRPNHALLETGTGGSSHKAHLKSDISLLPDETSAFIQTVAGFFVFVFLAIAIAIAPVFGL